MSASLSLDLAAHLWRCALPRGTSKLVLQCFCHHVNNESGLSWPSIARVALMCGLSERAVQGHVRGLVKAGILRPRLRIGHATRYTIHLDGLAPLVFASTLGSSVTLLDDQWQGAGAVGNLAQTPAAFAVTPAVSATVPAENGTPPPQISTSTPAKSAPITVLNSKENIEGTGAPALPATLMMIDGVSPKVLADFAAIRKAKRKGPITAAVIEEICQQAHLAGLSLEQALQTCCDPRRKWARFEAGWLQAAPGGGGNGGSRSATTAVTPAPTLWKPPVAKPAAPEVVAAGRERIAALRQATVGAGLGSSKSCGWAHAAIEKHQSGQPVRRAVLLDACAALRLDLRSLETAPVH